jgi:hypothetical protein
MKKMLVLVSLLIAAAACSTTPPGNKDITTNANSANANKGTEMKSTAMVSESDIIAKEKASWDAIKKKDWDGLGKMMASDYIQVLDDGDHDKASSLTGVKDFDLSDVTFADWKMLTIDKDAVIITYTATVKAQYKGEAVPPGPYREASAYVNRNGEWVTIYYQATMNKPMPPPPPSPAAAAAKPTKSPAGSPAKPAETGADPIANEKIVWDLFRAKNFDGFAALLAPEFLEAEATGLYDKAGSVKGVQEMDASVYALSDWKSLKFDNDAALVTYVLTSKGAKPEKEYHSSIWINRDGKWLALYHQGTPAAPATPAKPETKKM